MEVQRQGLSTFWGEAGEGGVLAEGRGAEGGQVGGTGHWLTVLLGVRGSRVRRAGQRCERGLSQRGARSRDGTERGAGDLSAAAVGSGCQSWTAPACADSQAMAAMPSSRCVRDDRAVCVSSLPARVVRPFLDPTLAPPPPRPRKSATSPLATPAGARPDPPSALSSAPQPIFRAPHCSSSTLLVSGARPGARECRSAPCRKPAGALWCAEPCAQRHRACQRVLSTTQQQSQQVTRPLSTSARHADGT